MIRLVAIGDTHLAQDARNESRLRALDQIVAESATLDADLFLWPGDLFHAKSTSADRIDLAERLQLLADMAPVLICRGNHDGDGELEIFGRLRSTFPIYVVTHPECLRLQCAGGAWATVAILPYPFKAGLVGAGVAHADQVDTAADVMDPIFMKFADDLARARAEGDLTFFMGHVNIAGSRLSSGQPNIGREIEIGRPHLDRLGSVLKIVNHIHLPQETGGAIYPGSIAPMNWGETHQCRYLLVELADSFTCTVHSRPLHSAPMFLVEGDLDASGFALAEDADEETQRRFMAADWSGCDVRCRYRYRASERAALDADHVHALFASALRLKVESVVIPDREVRAAGVATAKTLHDKLAAMRPDGLLPASVATKVTTLEQRDRDSVLADVRAWLAAIERGEIAERAA